MKYFCKGLFVFLTVIMSLVVVQSAFALTVTGTITEISTQPNKIVVDGTEVSGIRFNYLCNQYGICLEEGDVVSVECYEYVCSDGSILLKACTITVNDVTVALRACE